MVYQTKKQPTGLTLIEVMLAMVLSLFVMLALAKAFKLVGDRITYSQSELDLSADLREITTRVRRELVDARPILQTNPQSPAERQGYLVYHEGPFTRHTTSIIDSRNQRQPDDPDYQNTNFLTNSRYGDIDDYLAFTTESDDSLFVGYIPYGILAAKEFEKLRLQFGVSDIDFIGRTFFPDYSPQKAAELVPFYSNRAEIAYWVSPEWVTNEQGALEYDPNNGHPVFVDKDNDLLPDRLNLHRRVLLIRDDLNISMSSMQQANMDPPVVGPNTDKMILPFLVLGGNNKLRIEPLAKQLSASQNFYGVILEDDEEIREPGYWDNDRNATDLRTGPAPPWLIGLARVQQALDLSLSRVTDDWNDPCEWVPVLPDRDRDLDTLTGTPWQANFRNLTSTFGLPTEWVQANSMSSLQRPENRFAHVRMPEKLLSRSTPGTDPKGFKAPYGLGSSLPLLALSPPHHYLNGNAISGRFTMTGFLRPEFNLRERYAINLADGNSKIVKSIRGGTDIIASDILSFDIKTFDSTSPNYLSLGKDSLPSDSSNGVLDNDPFADADEEILLVDDINAKDVFEPGDPNFPMPYQNIGNGGFVDLGYPLLDGHPLGGVAIQGGQIPHANDLVSEFSNLDYIRNRNADWFYLPNDLQKSGKFVIRQRTDNPLVQSFHQPTFDTWTYDYRTDDDFDQEGLINADFEYAAPVPAVGAELRRRKRIWLQNNPEPDNHQGPWPAQWPIPAPKTINNGWDPNPIMYYGANNGEVYNLPTRSLFNTPRITSFKNYTTSYRNWSNMRVPRKGGKTWTDNGPLQPPISSNVPAYVRRGVDQIDVTPPYAAPLRGLQITIRILDPNTGQIRQQTIVQDF